MKQLNNKVKNKKSLFIVKPKLDVKAEGIAKENSFRNVFGELLGIKPLKITYEGLAEYLDNRLSTLKINPTTLDRDYDERRKYIEDYFANNEEEIANRISNNDTFKKATAELHRASDEGDKFLQFQIKLCNMFIKDLTKDFIEAEINYVIHTYEHLSSQSENEENLSRSSYITQRHKKYIEGDLLKFDIINKNFTTDWPSVDGVIARIGLLIYTFSILLRMKNSEWREAFMTYHQEREKEKAIRNLGKSRKKYNDKISAIGRSKKFSSQSEFHSKIKSIPNWQSLTKTKLAQELGYKSSSGLNELLKANKDWTLP